MVFSLGFWLSNAWFGLLVLHPQVFSLEFVPILCFVVGIAGFLLVFVDLKVEINSCTTSRKWFWLHFPSFPVACSCTKHLYIYPFSLILKNISIPVWSKAPLKWCQYNHNGYSIFKIKM